MHLFILFLHPPILSLTLIGKQHSKLEQLMENCKCGQILFHRPLLLCDNYTST
jgi:hypothetical protein